MKNIQIIDGANNCTYSIYAVTEEEFKLIFPNDCDIEFNTDLYSRLDDATAKKIFTSIWERPVSKKDVLGIHGTLFYGLDFKKVYYPTKKESEMINVFLNKNNQ